MIGDASVGLEVSGFLFQVSCCPETVSQNQQRETRNLKLRRFVPHDPNAPGVDFFPQRP